MGFDKEKWKECLVMRKSCLECGLSKRWGKEQNRKTGKGGGEVRSRRMGRF